LPFFVSRRVDFPARTNFLSRRKYAHPAVTAYIAISENVKKILMSDGIAENRIRVAYSGIDPDRFADLPSASLVRRQYKLGDLPVIGNIAALVGHKDQATLLRALALLKPALAWKCLIVGQGQLESSLKALAYAQLGLSKEQVIFCGFQADVRPFLAAFDIFAMSSSEEGLGTSVLDAMACALPVASTRGGGLPEMIDHERGGLLSPVKEPAALADSLERLLSDANLRRRMGNYNKKRVQDFHFRQTARQTLKVYEEFAG
jgi:glycosyltransferase involved in cell wall biosynthesis